MTDEQIDQLIAVRNYQTNRRDELTDWAQVDSIDVLLRDVPPGQRNDVDLLLGRLCAVLPVRSALQSAAHEVGVPAEWTPAPDNAQMIRIVQAAFNDPAIEY